MVRMMPAGTPVAVYLLVAVGGSAVTAVPFLISMRGKVLEKRRRDTLVAATILGVHGVQGVADRDGMDERLERVEGNVDKITKELHPSNGKSLAETVQATHQLAADAADHSIGLAQDLAEQNNENSERFRRLEEHLGVPCPPTFRSRFGRGLLAAVQAYYDGA
jgi:LmbE family N-acetylglucosaminyl deacetylase